MKRLAFVVCVVLSGLSIQAQAAPKSALNRGGLGFLFPDHNSFSNVGQFALSRGVAFQTVYENGGGLHAVEPSIVYGNGSLGLGVFGSRTGTEIFSGTDVVGGGIGVALVKEGVTLGFGGARQISEGAMNDGVIGGTLTMSGAKGAGPAIGLGVNTTVNQAINVMSGTVGVGYAFKMNTSIEAVLTFADIADFSAFDAAGYFTWAGQMVYLGSGFQYLNGGTSQLLGRLGFVLGKSIDLSGIVGYTLNAEDGLTYGGSLRANF